MSVGHATLGPSASERWATCPGSVEAEASRPPDPPSPYADLGTAAHWVFEQVNHARHGAFGNPQAGARQFLGTNVPVHDDGEEPRFVTVDEDMVAHVDSVADYVSRRIEEMSQVEGKRVPVAAFFEVPLDMAPILGDVAREAPDGASKAWGTGDVLLVSDYEVEGIDLKYGMGLVEVGTPDNPNKQLGLYGLGALSRYLGSSATGHRLIYRLTIAQPRPWHPDGPIRSVKLGLAHLQAFAEKMRTAIAAIVPEAPRVASEKGCQWCRARGDCAVRAEWVRQQATLPSPVQDATFVPATEAFALRNAADLTSEQIVRILDVRDVLRGFLSSVEEFAHKALVSGAAGPELKAAYTLEPGQSRRAWAEGNEDTILTSLTKIRWDTPEGKSKGLGKRDLMEQRLKTPAQVEKVLKASAPKGALSDTHWQAFNRLVVKPEGSLKLVPVSKATNPRLPRDPETMFGGELPPAPEMPGSNPFATPFG